MEVPANDRFDSRFIQFVRSCDSISVTYFDQYRRPVDGTEGRFLIVPRTRRYEKDHHERIFGDIHDLFLEGKITQGIAIEMDYLAKQFLRKTFEPVSSRIAKRGFLGSVFSRIITPLKDWLS